MNKHWRIGREVLEKRRAIHTTLPEVSAGECPAERHQSCASSCLLWGSGNNWLLRCFVKLPGDIRYCCYYYSCYLYIRHLLNDLWSLSMSLLGVSEKQRFRFLFRYPPVHHKTRVWEWLWLLYFWQKHYNNLSHFNRSKSRDQDSWEYHMIPQGSQLSPSCSNLIRTHFYPSRHAHTPLTQPYTHLSCQIIFLKFFRDSWFFKFACP